VVDLNLEKGQEVANRIGGLACRCDVSSSADIEQLLQFTLAQFGRLDIVVNNAGTTHPNKPAGEVTEAEFDRLYQVNVKSLFHMNRLVTPIFRQQGGGVFVNVASTTGVRPGPGLCWYSASKGAVITASKGLALELAKDQIRVCVINPMIGETPLMEQFMGMPDTPENRQKFLARIPLGRFTRPLDVAHAAVYLASDEAAFLTGVCLDVDGGRNI
jgi:NAD(P)-dependent dehydrogenase (short-subunit alcohol dehydrogenase family)